LSNSMLISMAGLKKAIFDHMINQFRSERCEKYLCVDRDEAGKQFTAMIMREYPGIKELIPDEQRKDWNDQLKHVKTRNILNLFSPNGHNTNNIEEWKNKIETVKTDNIPKPLENNENMKKTDKQADIFL